MNGRRAQVKHLQERIEELERELANAVNAKDNLLDVVNALLARSGGKVVIPVPEMQASRRHSIRVNLVRPDPEQAGDEGHFTIWLEGFEGAKAPTVEPVKISDLIWTPGKR